MKTNYLLIGILVMAACTSNTKKNNMEKEMIKNDSIQKVEIYHAILKFDEIFKNNGKQIIYTEGIGYKWLYVHEGTKKNGFIEDSVRIPIINKAVESLDFKNSITIRLKNEITYFKNSLEDPISLGYLLVRNYKGSSLRYILTKRDNLNIFSNLYQDDDISDFMSEIDYIKYHIARIHLINDSIAYYKNTEAELCLSVDDNIIYFKLIKDFTTGKWLLDDVTVCKKEEEEQYDIKLIGQPQPLKYYEANSYDYQE